MNKKTQMARARLCGVVTKVYGSRRELWYSEEAGGLALGYMRVRCVLKKPFQKA